MRNNNIIHIFREVNMSFQHDSLGSICNGAGISIKDLRPGEHVIFINASVTRLKLMSHGGLISYWKTPDGGKLNLNMVEFIPECFNARKGMDWKKADRMAIEKVFAKTRTGKELSDKRMDA